VISFKPYHPVVELPVFFMHRFIVVFNMLHVLQEDNVAYL